MYRLEADGSIFRARDTNDPVPCIKGNPDIAGAYGCTAVTEGTNRTPPYPFVSSTITISIDGSNGPDNDVYVYPYLWDAVPQELDMNGSQGNKPLAAVEAQMIAARTYIYQRMTYIDQYGTPNNSTQFHVFLPYRYQALTPPQRVRVQAAAAKRLYLTEANGTYPLEALYGADNATDTVEGNRPYLASIADPISAPYGVLDGTGSGGMSSKGVSRWAFGHTSSRGPVATDHPNYPHDDFVDATHPNGLGDFWSVQWENAFQILTHYYTGIHIRDAGAPNVEISEVPAARWNPLTLRWQTEDGTPLLSLCAGSTVTLEVWVQNSGTTTWPAAGEIGFSYRDLPGLLVQGAATADAPLVTPDEVIAPGDDYLVRIDYEAPTNVIDGHIVNPYFEMFDGDTPFSQLEAGNFWPNYSVQMTINQCDNHAYLPLVQGGLPSATSQ